MPKCSTLSSDATDTAGDIGRAILSHFDLKSDCIDRFYPEQNSKGLLLALTNGTVQKRAIVLDADKFSKEELDPAEELKLLLNSIPVADRSKVLDSRGLMERPSARTDAGSAITSVFDLESIFAAPEPVTYLIEPEIPAESVIYLAGVPESGKSTLACAWGRDLAARGHAVLLLDRDRNPRRVIRDRFERLGVNADDFLFWVWDSRQKSEPPQPNSPEVLEWVGSMHLATEKPPLVIVDSAISFLLPGEDENSSRDICALFNRCRAVVDAGGSVVLLHHLGKGGDLRGSSDFGAAADQGFIVTNSPLGTHRLSRLTLKVNKTRYALDVDLAYDYENGRLVRAELVNGEKARADNSVTRDDATNRTLVEVLRANPGIGTREFQSSAHQRDIPYNKAQKFLSEGVKTSKIRVGPQAKSRNTFCAQNLSNPVKELPSLRNVAV